MTAVNRKLSDEAWNALSLAFKVKAFVEIIEQKPAELESAFVGLVDAFDAARGCSDENRAECKVAFLRRYDEVRDFMVQTALVEANADLSRLSPEVREAKDLIFYEIPNGEGEVKIRGGRTLAEVVPLAINCHADNGMMRLTACVLFEFRDSIDFFSREP
jgi:hypothetical protein